MFVPSQRIFRVPVRNTWQERDDLKPKEPEFVRKSLCLQLSQMAMVRKALCNFHLITHTTTYLKSTSTQDWMKASANVLCLRTGLTSLACCSDLRGLLSSYSPPSHLFLPPPLPCCLPNFSHCTVVGENHSRQGFWVSQIWRWRDVTWHTEGRGRRWGL